MPFLYSVSRLRCVPETAAAPNLDALIVTARISASIYLVLAASRRSFVRAGVCWRDGLGARAWGRVCRASGAVLLCVVAFLIFIGAFLEPGPAIVIFVPLLLPIARGMGIDPMQFSIVFVLTLALGLSTPPIGLCLFIACKIGRIRMGPLFRALWPFFVAGEARR